MKGGQEHTKGGAVAGIGRRTGNYRISSRLSGGVLLLFLLLFPGRLHAQTDTEFWFAAPKITESHHTGGIPIYIRIASLNIPANVTISIPANPGFVPITVNLGANEAQTIDISAWRNDLENNPYLNTDPVDKGIRIQADNLITAYYEVGTGNNPDIFALKGKNALGTEFFVPFQNYFRNGNYTQQPYHSIAIVATMDNTEVTIIPTNPVHGKPAGEPFTVTLNRGQTYAIGPAGMGGTGHPRQGQLPENRLAGTRIISSEPVAVTTADDSVDADPHGTCKDLIGDQIVPVSIIGTEYIAMRGRLNAVMRESVYITATADGTVVEIDGSIVTTLNAGGVHRHQFTQARHHIKTSKPAYAYHVAGFGCEMGGAILPPVNVCTGSTQVSFTRSKGESFFMNILVRKGAEGGFILNGNEALIQAGDFHDVPGTSDWLAAEFEFTQAVIPVGVASLIRNTKDVFHLGIINGGQTTGTMYGYFSDFNELKVQAFVAGTTSNVLRTCYGVPVQLRASGGTKYVWEPFLYLDDPFSDTPIANPLESTNYRVSVSGACNMGDTATISVQVSTYVEAMFTFDNNHVCAPKEVTFHNRSTGGVNHSWYVNNTLIYETSLPEDITYTFENDTDQPVEYTIELVVNNVNSCNDIMQRTITVYPAVKSDFSAGTINGCDPLEVQFNNLSSGNTDKWYWDFGDGASSDHVEPFHVFLNRQSADNIIYPVTLVTVSPFHCRDTSTVNITVSPYIEAGFTFGHPEGCSPWPVDFKDLSVGAVSYEWNFGDGNTDDTSLAEFTHLFEHTGPGTAIYTISQVVSNLQGCSDTLERNITVHPTVTAAFMAEQEEGCSPHSVKFTNGSTGAAGYRWEFGDGSSAVEPGPVHNYPANLTGQNIIYDVMLVANSAEGCTDTAFTAITVYPWIEASFTLDIAKGCHLVTVTANNMSTGATKYLWSFGDGSISTSDAPEVTHTYSNTGTTDTIYLLTLLVTNDQGCRDTLVREVVVYPELTSNFTPTPEAVCEPIEIGFTDLSKNAAGWKWDFGDGTGSYERHPTHRFFNSGTTGIVRTVQLTTTSANGQCTAVNSWNIIVNGRVEAGFETGVNNGCSPFDVEFINQSTGGIEYIWNFDDGTEPVTRSADPFTYTFNNSSDTSIQSYEVSLVAINEAGCTSEKIKTILVQPAITARFIPSDSTGCHPLTVTFTNDTEGGQWYSWDFGDGNSSSDSGPVHTFTNTGKIDSIYRVILYADAGNNMCSDSFYADIVVHPNVKADFHLDSNIGCSPSTVIIENTSINGNVFNWDFGDGTGTVTYSGDSFERQFSNPSHQLPVSYDIRLMAGSEAGCTSEKTVTLTLYPSISAVFVADSSGCHPLPVDFTWMGNGAEYFEWDFGNGNSSSDRNPDHVFTNTGTIDSVYQVRLVTTALNNVCTDTFHMDIRVHPYIKSEFSIPSTSGCTPFEVTLANSSVGGERYEWEFGDGSDTLTYNKNSFPRIFSNAGYETGRSYIIGMTAVNYAGCTDYSEKTVGVHHDITALFEPSVTEGCHPLEVEFTNFSLGSNRFEWVFGDGASSVTEKPIHTFTNTGTTPLTRRVILHSFSGDHCADEYTMDITIYPNPRAGFETDITVNCPPFNQPVLNTSTGADRYTWIFGDGQQLLTDSKEIFQYVYDNDEEFIRTYNLTLVAETEFGCTDTVSHPVQIYPRVTAAFTSVTSGCSPLHVQFENRSTGAVSYRWDYGDGLDIGIKDPGHVYFNNTHHDKVFPVTMTAISEYGCSATTGSDITVFPQPEAEFTVTPLTQQYPSTTADIVNASKDGIWQYKWDFDDGNISYDRDPANHSFIEWGEYIIRLEVSNGNCSDYASRRVYIAPPRPVAAFEPLLPGCVPHTIQFRNTSVYGQSYHWDFDDGNTSTETEPRHTYLDHGLYNVKLTVYGPGGEDYLYRQVEAYRNPIVDFRVVPDILLLPDEEARLYNMSEYGSRYEWDFGDGNYSSEKDPLHLYTSLGVYDITLTVWTEHECSGYMFLGQAVTVVGSGSIVFPNAFRPDLSGPSGGYYDISDQVSNTIFRPVWEGVAEYRLRIYNRWGEFLFESNDVMQGWDGYYKGKLSKQDVYVWKAWITFYNGTKKVMAGDVTLMR
jgi:PKD repeat protein